MKSKMILLTTILILSCSSNENSVPTESVLTAEEQSDLIHLREEEKLARDVYLYAYSKYNLLIAKNISNSEQTHMDQVLQILNRYNLTDQSSSTEGEFHIEELQQLYDELTAKVDLSEKDALLVGATIEDLDIKDIQHFLSRTGKDDIAAMYESLMCGSRNHLRSYNSQLEENGLTYTPQFISTAEFYEIVTSDKEMCYQVSAQ